MYDNPTGVAGGAITPASFIKLDGTSDFTFDQAGSGDMPFGVSQDSSELAPAFGQSTNLAAAAPDQVPYYGEGQTCLLTLGTGGATPGTLLMPDSSGNGIAHTGSNWYGAIALQNGNVGEKIKVRVRVGYN